MSRKIKYVCEGCAAVEQAHLQPDGWTGYGMSAIQPSSVAVWCAECRSKGVMKNDLVTLFAALRGVGTPHQEEKAGVCIEATEANGLQTLRWCPLDSDRLDHQITKDPSLHVTFGEPEQIAPALPPSPAEKATKP